MLRFIPCFSLLIFFFLAPPAFSDPQLDARITQNKIRVNELTEYQVQIEWPKKEGQYSFALPEPQLENLMLVNQGESQEVFSKEDGEWTRKVFTFELKPEKKGEGRVKGFMLPYINAALGKKGTFDVSEIKVSIKNPPFPWVKWGIGLAVLALSIAGAVFFMTRRKRKEREEIANPELSEEEKSAKRIRSVLENQSPKEALYQISAEFRSFLADHYQIKHGKSENELLIGISEANISNEEKNLIRGLIEKLAEAKYGTMISDSDLKRLEQQILEFVEGKRVLGNIKS
jgi:hypothetical protein